MAGHPANRENDMSTANEIVNILEELRAEEGASVCILCKNPDFGNNLKNEGVICQAGFTGWKEERFDGDTLLEALGNAVKALHTRPPKMRINDIRTNR
jgi:hypothetical protein